MSRQSGLETPAGRGRFGLDPLHYIWVESALHRALGRPGDVVHDSRRSRKRLIYQDFLKRVTGVEPATFSLGS